MDQELLPTKYECLRYVLETALHSCRYHYYLERLGLPPVGPKSELPHDIAGIGNKFEWEVMRGLALNGTSSDILRAVAPSREFHRQQYHHRIWNGEEMHPEATLLDLQTGAVDIISALLEPRQIYGGPHTFEQIMQLESVKNNPAHKLKAIGEMVAKMQKVPPPRLEGINCFNGFPRKIEGLSRELYAEIYHRALDARIMVELKYSPQRNPV